MPDAPVTAAPETAAAPPSAPKKDPVPYKFKFTPGPSFSIDGFLINQYMEGTVHLNEQMTVTFRTLSVEQTQHVERSVDVQNQSLTIKYIANEMTIAQIYHALQAMQGKSIPAIPADYGTKDYKPEADFRRKWIRGLPGVIFDLITVALGEFERHAKEIVSPENIRNF